ncbi:MAG TPA: TlpA disulfide reductase family protein [Sphingobacterium sp.]|nr:TlpA disulfide reductase family protein [Sphingobacterium sp.]
MKRITLFLMLFIPTVLVFAQQQYTINGTVPDEYNGSYVRLSELDPYDPLNTTPVHIDSAYISDGQFSFKGGLPDDAILCMVTLNNISGMFVLDSEPLHANYVDSNLSGYFQIRGSTLNNDFSKITEYPYKQANEMVAVAKKRTEALAKNEWTLEDDDAAREDEKKSAINFVEYIRKFVKENIDNPAGQYGYILYGVFFKGELKDEIESKLSDNEKQKMKSAKESIAEMMATMKSTLSTEKLLKVGDKYIDAEGEMLSGEKKKLSEVISSKKLILLDFWASWCIPCLKEMPEIAKLHHKHKDQGLQIVGISLDKNREKWRNAVESIGMPWVQFIDSNLSNPISGIYGANAIPHTVLIDECGYIVAVGLRGHDLKEKIAELLSE